ncbi:MAG: peptidyl-prolyl cis-trans isomerase [Thermodesulfobacteriota bacterium]|nr:peptidyl-prolyl cis-trans isomerase [Thermodesulfobacteriota bacterium]
MKKCLTLLLCLFLISSHISCKRGKEQILVKIGNQIITVDEFTKEFEEVRQEYLTLNTKDNISFGELKASFLNGLIEKKILLNEAERLGIKVTEDELKNEISHIKKDYPEKSFNETIINEYVDYKDWEKRIKKKLLIEKLINNMIKSKISIENEEIKRYYEKNIKEFDLPEQVRAFQIVVGTEVEAHEILKRLKDGEDFVKLAKEKSLSPDSEDGGDLGYFGRGYMPPEFDEVVFSLPIGQLSKVVKSPYGFHVFKVEEKKKARKMLLDEAYDQIEERLKKERTEEAYNRWFKKIKNMIQIELDQQLLTEIQ